MIKNILVTGANGFIGRNLIINLLKNFDYNVWGLSRKKSSLKIENEKYHSIENFDLNKNNLNNLNHLKFDLCFHCAANSNYLEKNKNLFIRDNIEVTQKLVDYLKDKDIKLFVYLSTVGVHDRKYLETSETKINENSPLSAKSAYGESKVKTEKIVIKSGISYLIVRPTWIFGFDMDKSSHLRQIYQWSKDKKIITRLFFKGRVTVCEINSFCSALIKLSQKKDRKHNIYIVGDNNHFNFSDLFKITNKKLYFEKVLNLFSKFSIFFPSKLRILMEDYLVCDLKRLNEEGIKIENDNIDLIRSYNQNQIW